MLILRLQGPEIEKLKDQLKQAGTKEQELGKQVEGLRAQHNKAIKDLDAKSLEVNSSFPLLRRSRLFDF